MLIQSLVVALAGLGLAAQPTPPPPAAPAPVPAAPTATPTAAELSAKAVAYLRSVQDASGGWSVNPKGPTFPAITGLVLSGMLADPAITADDPAVAKGLAFILRYQQADGGIYDTILPSYNTAICLSALSKVKNPDAATKAAITKARDFLTSLQYGEGALLRQDMGEAAKVVTKDDPFYGGFGYGNHGRPDMSNTGFALEALRDAGLPESDPAFQRALVFLRRCQMIEKGADGTVINEMPYAKGSRQGGFIYATSENKDKVGTGSSAAGTIEESLTDGTSGNRLRSYGTMTYTGFKSYLYAGLPRSDPRVMAAMDWIRRHYELRWNAGMPTPEEGGSPGQVYDGTYYYYVVFARALKANGEPTISVIKDGGKTERRQWAADLTAQLATLQQPDGSFKSLDDRWMEDNTVLITAYALIALGEAR